MNEVYFFIDYSSQLSMPMNYFFSKIDGSFEYLNWLNYKVNSVKIFEKMHRAMETEFKGIDLDNISENSLIELYYRCFFDVRKNLFEKLDKTDILNSKLSPRDRAIKTLDWIQKVKYDENDYYLLYLIKDFEFTSTTIDDLTYHGYMISLLLPERM